MAPGHRSGFSPFLWSFRQAVPHGGIQSKLQDGDYVIRTFADPFRLLQALRMQSGAELCLKTSPTCWANLTLLRATGLSIRVAVC